MGSVNQIDGITADRERWKFDLGRETLSKCPKPVLTMNLSGQPIEVFVDEIF